MIRKECNEKLAALVLIVSVAMLAVASTGSCQTGTRTVGVKAGDWVKYRVTKLGPETLAWVYQHAVWFKVEVLNVSGTTVKFRETIHWDDRDESVFICSLDVQCVTDRCGYFIGADLEPGGKIGEYPILTSIYKSVYVHADLRLNNTEFRTYGGVTREVNPVKISYVSPYYVFTVRYTWERYWDRHTGFLLEKKVTCYILNCPEIFNETNPASTYIMEVADTNMWKMKTGQTFPWQPFAVVIPVGAIIAVAVAIKLRNNRKKNEAEEK